MKIIFDNEEQKKQFMDNNCPGEFGYDETRGCEESKKYLRICPKCWEQSGVEMEVQGE